MSLSSLRRQTRAVSIDFFERPAAELAPALVGSVLLHRQTAGMIVETEAYLGLDDLAAHASRGRTERTRVLFGPAGRAYVYFIYGMHECLNVVAEHEGSPGCVLIRALAPLCGLPEMFRRRAWHGAVTGLANGPGKLTEALAITRQQYGCRMDRGDLTIRLWRRSPEVPIAVTPRVGISQCVDWPLRFIWSGHPCLSRPLVGRRNDSDALMRACSSTRRIAAPHGG
jgi:DNA-3-methyladenine glycosylase